MSSQSVDVPPGAKKRLNVGSIFNVPITTAQTRSDKAVLIVGAFDTGYHDLGLGLDHISFNSLSMLRQIKLVRK